MRTGYPGTSNVLPWSRSWLVDHYLGASWGLLGPSPLSSPQAKTGHYSLYLGQIVPNVLDHNEQWRPKRKILGGCFFFVVACHHSPPPWRIPGYPTVTIPSAAEDPGMHECHKAIITAILPLITPPDATRVRRGYVVELFSIHRGKWCRSTYWPVLHQLHGSYSYFSEWTELWNFSRPVLWNTTLYQYSLHLMLSVIYSATND